MRRDALPRFLDGWSPHELTLADMPGSPDPERTDEIVLALGTAAYYDEPVLPGLPGSCLLYSGHDDCYLHVESTDQTVPPALLSRLLALLAGSALAHAFPVEVPEPATVIAESLTADHAHWTGPARRRIRGHGNHQPLRRRRAMAARSSASGANRPHRHL